MYSILPYLHAPVIVSKSEEADFILDDIIDSGATRAKYTQPFYALIEKVNKEEWIIFPWEGDAVGSAEDIVTRQLQFLGEDPARDGLKETPKRVVKAWGEMFSGYNEKPEDFLCKQFENEEKYDEMVISKDIDFISYCVVGSTFVETPKGRIPIRYLKNEDFVYSYNTRLKRFEVEKCFNPQITRRAAKLVRVYTDKDTLLCTPDHKILTFNRGWVKAIELISGESVVALNKGLVKCNDIYRPTMASLDGNGWRYEHQIVYGKTDRIIHHIDLNPSNNDPRNLTTLSKSAHTKIHAYLDARGPREAERWRNMTDAERFLWEKKRKAGLLKVHLDPIRRKIMIEKRSTSVKAHWDMVKADKKLYQKRIGNMNHKIISVENVSWKEDVWCMDVLKNHNFVANGIVVHNCEHHLMPFYGRVHIAYIPKDKIVGLSKLSRVVDCFAKRLQVQERMTQQIANSIEKYLEPQGVAVFVEGSHLCQMVRGIKKQNSIMVTSALKGVLKEQAARMEFLMLTRK